MKIPKPDQCVVPNCERKRDRPADLTCKAHWALTPRRLKVAFWAAGKLKSPKANEWQTIVAATNIVDYLEKKKVVLPPDTTVIGTAPLLVDANQRELVKDQPKIIQPGRLIR